MPNQLVFWDYLIFALYLIIIVSYGYWVYRKRRKTEVSGTHNFFLAEGSLTWWAIGASIIASNISAEQFIGMSGDGFFVGIAVAIYEWLGAAALILVAVFFIPIYIQNRIFTMPQFLTRRYNEQVALIMSIFWLFLYIFVNLTSILYLGALAINGLLGGAYFHEVMVILAVFAIFITLGGMKVIGYTDAIQVSVLIIGGLATTYMALLLVSEHFGLGRDAFAAFKTLMKEAPDHFHLMITKPKPGASQDAIDKYLILPAFGMYAAGQWISNLNYWGCNQYITQRALGADLKTARTGILFASLLKILMPVIVMLPGIIAYVLHRNGALPGMEGGNKDAAYASILAFLPAGLKGLAVAALTAAIVASLAGKANSISTIFTMDIYKKYLRKHADEQAMVKMGRLVIIIAMLLSVAFTWNDLLGISGEGGYTFVQKYSSFISPGVFAVFLLGMFWKRTSGTAAIVGILVGFLSSVFFNQLAVYLFGPETWLYSAFRNRNGIYEIPFFISLSWSFFITVLCMVVVSLQAPKVSAKAFELNKQLFKLEPSSIILSVTTLLLLSLIYARFW